MTNPTYITGDVTQPVGDDEFADAIEDMIPRATVAAALRELRAELVADANAMATHGSGISACTIQDAFDATIAKLGLTAEAFDAAIASRPDALEKLAYETMEEAK